MSQKVDDTFKIVVCISVIVAILLLPFMVYTGLNQKSDDVVCLYITKDGTIIDGKTIKDYKVGIIVDANNVTIVNSRFDECNIGISVTEDSKYVTISDCYFRVYNLAIDDRGEYCIIHGNIVKVI